MTVAPVVEIMHEDNDWGISLVEEESTETPTASQCTQSELVEGLQVNIRKLLWNPTP